MAQNVRPKSVTSLFTSQSIRSKRRRACVQSLSGFENHRADNQPAIYYGEVGVAAESCPDEAGRRLQLAGLDMRAKQWEAAIPVYETHLKKNADDARVWSQLGDAYYGAKQYERAGDAYSTASRNAPNDRSLRGRACYNVACSFALAHDPDRAIEQLTLLVDSGFDNRDVLMNDSDLAGVRDDPGFRTLLARLDAKAE